MREPISVMIVDDHLLVREGICTFLSAQSDIEVVASVGTAQDAIERATALAPDVILMDLILEGDMNGVEATRHIRDLSPRTRIIMLTSYHDDNHVVSAMRAGALSYLLKSVKPDTLAEAIRCAVRDEATLDTRVAATLVSQLHNNGATTDPLMALSEREVEVLHRIAEGNSNSEIAEELGVSVKTVRCHVSNILSKLHLRDRTQLAIYAWKQGVVHNSE